MNSNCSNRKVDNNLPDRLWNFNVEDFLIPLQNENESVDRLRETNWEEFVVANCPLYKHTLLWDNKFSFEEILHFFLVLRWDLVEGMVALKK